HELLCIDTIVRQWVTRSNAASHLKPDDACLPVEAWDLLRARARLFSWAVSSTTSSERTQGHRRDDAPTELEDVPSDLCRLYWERRVWAEKMYGATIKPKRCAQCQVNPVDPGHRFCASCAEQRTVESKAKSDRKRYRRNKLGKHRG